MAFTICLANRLGYHSVNLDTAIDSPLKRGVLPAITRCTWFLLHHFPWRHTCIDVEVVSTCKRFRIGFLSLRILQITNSTKVKNSSASCFVSTPGYREFSTFGDPNGCSIWKWFPWSLWCRWITIPKAICHSLDVLKSRIFSSKENRFYPCLGYSHKHQGPHSGLYHGMFRFLGY